jgi:hypothetical protein
MNEITKLVMEKAGLTEEQASASVETVTNYIKDRVPQMVHGQLDKIIAGMSLEESIRNQVDDLGSEVKERTEGLARDLKNAFEGAFKSKKDSGQG